MYKHQKNCLLIKIKSFSPSRMILIDYFNEFSLPVQWINGRELLKILNEFCLKSIIQNVLFVRRLISRISTKSVVTRKRASSVDLGSLVPCTLAATRIAC